MFYYFRLCIFAVVKMDNRNLYTNKQNIMEAKYITLTKENIEKEHICCAFSDKKCKDSYEEPVEYALSNSLGFGGHNASILLKAYK